MEKMPGRISYYELNVLVHQLLDLGYSRSAVYKEVISTERVMAKTLAKLLAAMPTRHERVQQQGFLFLLWGMVALNFLVLSACSIWTLFVSYSFGPVMYLGMLQFLLLAGVWGLPRFTRIVFAIMVAEASFSLFLSFILPSMISGIYWSYVIWALCALRLVLVLWMYNNIGSPLKVRKVPYRNSEGQLRLKLEFEFVRDK
jgi:hypothetical protein